MKHETKQHSIDIKVVFDNRTYVSRQCEIVCVTNTKFELSFGPDNLRH